MIPVPVWYDHFIFFRRYGIEDSKTFLLNSLLLFVISVALALLAPRQLRPALGGFSYGLLWPLHMIHGRIRDKRERAALESMQGGD